jgi:mannose-6-phosphate isomerase-like protein (cupin superfamily)
VENVQRGATHVASGEGKTLWVLGDLYEFKATGEDTGGTFALWETTTPPGNPGPPPHIHHNEDEAFYILEGELELMVEGRASVVGAGTFVNILKGTLHTFKNAGTTPARFLGLVAPAGFEGFFEEIGEPATDPSSSPPADPPDVGKIMAAAPKYGLEIPPPTGA